MKRIPLLFVVGLAAAAACHRPQPETVATPQPNADSLAAAQRAHAESLQTAARARADEQRHAACQAAPELVHARSRQRRHFDTPQMQVAVGFEFPLDVLGSQVQLIDDEEAVQVLEQGDRVARPRVLERADIGHEKIHADIPKDGAEPAPDEV